MKYKHSLGQNFIYDEALLARLVDAAGVREADDILEIGPGAGTLTVQLAQRARRLLSVEIDRDLLPVLERTLSPYPNVEVVCGDALKLDLAALTSERFGERFKVVANLPYYITTEMLTKLLFSSLPVDTIAVMVQREVGDKLMSAPRDDGYGPLALACQYFAEVARAMIVPAGCFTPPPKVDSAFMVLSMRREPPVPGDPAMLFRAIRAGFAMRRKTLVNNLQAAFALNRQEAEGAVAAAGLPLTVRGERLSLADFARLAQGLCAQEKTF